MKFEIKDPGSAITHFIGMLMAAFAATPLLIRCRIFILHSLKSTAETLQRNGRHRFGGSHPAGKREG